jgi:hypothetical protein
LTSAPEFLVKLKHIFIGQFPQLPFRKLLTEVFENAWVFAGIFSQRKIKRVTARVWKILRIKKVCSKGNSLFMELGAIDEVFK